jgi:hypothetical protein
MPYQISPFSSPNYQKNASKVRDGATPCAICGRGVNEPWPFTAIVVDGGAHWGTDNDPTDDPGYMGCWPIGADCHRRYKVTE